MGARERPGRGFHCPGTASIKKDVHEAIRAIRDAGTRLVSLSAHDSSDWAIEEFRKAFGSACVDLLVGSPIRI
ncbi:MAG: hypothetical protein JW838_14200 [Spirochaetes bacterium]|nr:hypothetical protein [Spirochaetota bacterium]